jgi:hypothetical protein
MVYNNISHASARHSILLSFVVVAAIVGSTSALSHGGMLSTTNSPSSSLVLLSFAGARRRRQRRSSLEYRNSANVDDTIDGFDHYFTNIMKGGNDDDILHSEYSGNNIIEQVTDEEGQNEEEEEDALSRALTRRTTHHHDHFPDAVRDLLSSIPLPTLPPHWIVTSEAMEAIVGGAGGAGVLLHLHNAGRALGLHDMDLHDMDGSIPPLLSSSSSSSRGDEDNILLNDYTATIAELTTTIKTKKLRKEVVDTAKAFVPVAVEIGVVDTLARYFN